MVLAAGAGRVCAEVRRGAEGEEEDAGVVVQHDKKTRVSRTSGQGTARVGVSYRRMTKHRQAASRDGFAVHICGCSPGRPLASFSTSVFMAPTQSF